MLPLYMGPPWQPKSDAKTGTSGISVDKKAAHNPHRQHYQLDAWVLDAEDNRVSLDSGRGQLPHLHGPRQCNSDESGTRHHQLYPQLRDDVQSSAGSQVEDAELLHRMRARIDMLLVVPGGDSAPYSDISFHFSVKTLPIGVTGSTVLVVGAGQPLELSASVSDRDEGAFLHPWKAVFHRNAGPSAPPLSWVTGLRTAKLVSQVGALAAGTS